MNYLMQYKLLSEYKKELLDELFYIESAINSDDDPKVIQISDVMNFVWYSMSDSDRDEVIRGNNKMYNIKFVKLGKCYLNLDDISRVGEETVTFRDGSYIYHHNDTSFFKVIKDLEVK